MRKIKGITAILVSAFFILIFLIMWGILLFEPRMKNPGTGDLIKLAIGTVVFMIMGVYGIIYGIKQIRFREHTEPEIEPFPLDILIKFQVQYAEYRKLMLQLMFPRSKMIPLGIFSLYLIYAMGSLAVQGKLGNNLYINLILTVVVVGGVIFSATRIINNNFKSNAFFREQLQFHLTTDNISIEGETFKNQLAWNSFYKVTEKKEWFVLYQGKYQSIIIPKTAFQSEIDINQFRLHLKTLNGVKKELQG